MSGVTKMRKQWSDADCIDVLDETMRRKLLLVGAAVAFGVWTLFAWLTWNPAAPTCAWAMLTCALAMGLGPVVARFAGSGVGGSYFVMLLITGLAVTAIVRGGFEPAVAQWYAIVPLTAVLGGRPRKAWLWVALSAIAVVGVFVAEQQQWLGPRMPSSRFGPVLSTVALLATLILLGMVIHRCREAAFARYAELQTELFQAQKLDGLGRLAGGIAHDFNNLLSVIGTRAELAASQDVSDADRTKDLAAIRAAAAQGAALTQDLVAFAGGSDAGSTESLQACEVVHDVSRLLERVLPSRVRLVLRLDTGVGHVMASHRRLHQVLMNLVLNAKEAMPDGGSILVAVDRFVGRPPGPGGAVMRGREFIRIRVADEGIGMTEHTRRRALEPFYTTKARGTGLGLATVHRIVREFEGTIDVTSTPGEGSTFDVYLPTLPTAGSVAAG